MLIRKILSVSLSLIFTSNVVLGSLSEANFWKERRSSVLKENNHVQVASLPIPTLPGAGSALSLESIKPIVHKNITLNLPKAFEPILNSIPLSRVTIQDVYAGLDPKSVPLILVQDVHLNLEAQNNISVALSQLLTTKNIGMIFIEGAFSSINLEPFRHFSQSLREKVAEGYFHQNLLAAPSYVGLLHPDQLPGLEGVDDRSHYWKNVQAYLDSRRNQKSLLKIIEAEKNRLQEQKNRYFSGDLKAFDVGREAHNSSQLSLGAYLKKLTAIQTGDLKIEQFLSAWEMESTLNFEKVEQERKWIFEKLSKSLLKDELKNLLDESLAYKMGELSFGDYYQNLKILCERKGISLKQVPEFENYIRYVLLSDRINAEQLFQSISELEKSIGEKLARTPLEKNLLSQSELLSLTSKLVNFSLTPSEWDEYKKSKGIVIPAKACLARLGGNDDILSSFENFYQEADIRSEKMIDNFLASSSRTRSTKSAAIRDPEHQVLNLDSRFRGNDGVSILVAGGFHTPQIAHLLREKKISYIALSPKITKIEDATGNAYLSIFSREKMPLEGLFETKKLTLAPPDINLTPRTQIRTLRDLLYLRDGRVPPRHVPASGFPPGFLGLNKLFGKKRSGLKGHQPKISPQSESTSSRREFLRQSTLLSLGLVALGSFMGCSSSSLTPEQEALNGVIKILKTAMTGFVNELKKNPTVDPNQLFKKYFNPAQAAILERAEKIPPLKNYFGSSDVRSLDPREFLALLEPWFYQYGLYMSWTRIPQSIDGKSIGPVDFIFIGKLIEVPEILKVSKPDFVNPGKFLAIDGWVIPPLEDQLNGYKTSNSWSYFYRNKPEIIYNLTDAESWLEDYEELERRIKNVVVSREKVPTTDTFPSWVNSMRMDLFLKQFGNVDFHKAEFKRTYRYVRYVCSGFHELSHIKILVFDTLGLNRLKSAELRPILETEAGFASVIDSPYPFLALSEALGDVELMPDEGNSSSEMLWAIAKELDAHPNQYLGINRSLVDGLTFNDRVWIYGGQLHKLTDSDLKKLISESLNFYRQKIRNKYSAVIPNSRHASIDGKEINAEGSEINPRESTKPKNFWELAAGIGEYSHQTSSRSDSLLTRNQIHEKLWPASAIPGSAIYEYLQTLFDGATVLSIKTINGTGELEGGVVKRVTLPPNPGDTTKLTPLQWVQRELMAKEEKQFPKALDFLYNSTGDLIAIVGVFDRRVRLLSTLFLGDYYYTLSDFQNPESTTRKNDDVRQRTLYENTLDDAHRLVKAYESSQNLATPHEDAFLISGESAVLIEVDLKLKKVEVSPVFPYSTDLSERWAANSLKGIHQVVIPVYPTVFPPSSKTNRADDRVYYRALLGHYPRDFHFDHRGRTLVDFAGSGLDAYIAALSTGGGIWVNDINPFALATIRNLFALSGMKKRLHLYDPGQRLKFDTIIGNMPAHKSKTTSATPTLSALHDNVGRDLLLSTSQRTPNLLAPSGQALFWNLEEQDPDDFLGHDEVEFAFRSAGAYLETEPLMRTSEWFSKLQVRMNVRRIPDQERSPQLRPYLVEHVRTPKRTTGSAINTSGWWVKILKLLGVNNPEMVAVAGIGWWLEAGITVGSYLWANHHMSPIYAGLVALGMYALLNHSSRVVPEGDEKLTTEWLWKTNGARSPPTSLLKDVLIYLGWGSVFFVPFFIAYHFFPHNYWVLVPVFVIFSLGLHAWHSGQVFIHQPHTSFIGFCRDSSREITAFAVKILENSSLKLVLPKVPVSYMLSPNSHSGVSGRGAVETPVASLEENPLLNAYAYALGLNIEHPPSAPQIGLWERPLVLTETQRRNLELMRFNVLPLDKWHGPGSSPVKILYEDHRPVALISEGHDLMNANVKGKEFFPKDLPCGIILTFDYFEVAEKSAFLRRLNDYWQRTRGNRHIYIHSFFAEHIQLGGRDVFALPGAFGSDDTTTMALIRDDSRLDGATFLDAFSGSGVVGRNGALRGARRIVSFDKSPQAFLGTRFTAKLSGHPNWDVRQGDVAHLDQILNGEKFDVIAANPPMPHQVDNNDPDTSDPDMTIIDHVLGTFDRHLNPGGRLEISYQESAAFLLRVYREGWVPLRISETLFQRSRVKVMVETSRFTLVRRPEKYLETSRLHFLLSDLQVLSEIQDHILDTDYKPTQAYDAKLAPIAKRWREDSTFEGQLMSKCVQEVMAMTRLHAAQVPIPNVRVNADLERFLKGGFHFAIGDAENALHPHLTSHLNFIRAANINWNGSVEVHYSEPMDPEFTSLPVGSPARLKRLAEHRYTVELDLNQISSNHQLIALWWTETNKIYTEEGLQFDEINGAQYPSPDQKNISGATQFMRRWVQPHGRVLDFGSGIGQSVISLAGAGANFVDGIEISAKLTALANHNIQEWGMADKAAVTQGNIISLPSTWDQQFDRVFCRQTMFMVLPYFRPRILQGAHRVLKDDGYAIFLEENPDDFPMADDLHTWAREDWETELTRANFDRIGFYPVAQGLMLIVAHKPGATQSAAESPLATGTGSQARLPDGQGDTDRRINTSGWWVKILKLFGAKNPEMVAVAGIGWWLEAGITIGTYIWAGHHMHPIFAGLVALGVFAILIHSSRVVIGSYGKLTTEWLWTTNGSRSPPTRILKNVLTYFGWGAVFFVPFFIAHHFFPHNFWILVPVLLVFSLGLHAWHSFRAIQIEPSLSGRQALKLIPKDLGDRHLVILALGTNKFLNDEIAFARANPGVRIIATTKNKDIVEPAKKRAEAEGFHNQIEIRPDDATLVWPYPSGSAGFIYSRLMLHYLSDEQVKHVFSEMKRVAAPGAKIFVTVNSDKHHWADPEGKYPLDRFDPSPRSTDQDGIQTVVDRNNHKLLWHYDPRTKLTYHLDLEAGEYRDRHYFSPDELKSYAKSCGFIVEKTWEHQEHLFVDVAKRERPVQSHASSLLTLVASNTGDAERDQLRLDLLRRATGSSGKIEIEFLAGSQGSVWMVRTNMGIFRFSCKKEKIAGIAVELYSDDEGNIWSLDSTGQIHRIQSRGRLPRPVPVLITDRFFKAWTHELIERWAKNEIPDLLKANHLGGVAIQNLNQLRQDLLSNGVIPPLPPYAHRAKEWNSRAFIGQHWHNARVSEIELHAYLNRLILEAVGYDFKTGESDPFLSSKQQALEDGLPSFEALLEKTKDKSPADKLAIFLDQALWGNKYDPTHAVREERHMILDQTNLAIQKLLDPAKKIISYDADNSGPEILTDLLLIRTLLNLNPGKRITLQVKPTPLFISDVTHRDFQFVLERLQAPSSSSRLKALAVELDGYIRSGRLMVEEDPSSADGTNFESRPQSFRRTKSHSDLVILKGDANYRWLTGANYWGVDQDVRAVLPKFFPDTLILRVCKHDTAIGVDKSRLSELVERDPIWYKHGTAGMIQYVEKSPRRTLGHAVYSLGLHAWQSFIKINSIALHRIVNLPRASKLRKRLGPKLIVVSIFLSVFLTGALPLRTHAQEIKVQDSSQTNSPNSNEINLVQEISLWLENGTHPPKNAMNQDYANQRDYYFKEQKKASTLLSKKIEELRRSVPHKHVIMEIIKTVEILDRWSINATNTSEYPSLMMETVDHIQYDLRQRLEDILENKEGRPVGMIGSAAYILPRLSWSEVEIEHQYRWLQYLNSQNVLLRSCAQEIIARCMSSKIANLIINKALRHDNEDEKKIVEDLFMRMGVDAVPYLQDNFQMNLFPGSKIKNIYIKDLLIKMDQYGLYSKYLYFESSHFILFGLGIIAVLIFSPLLLFAIVYLSVAKIIFYLASKSIEWGQAPLRAFVRRDSTYLDAPFFLALYILLYSSVIDSTSRRAIKALGNYAEKASPRTSSFLATLLQQTLSKLKDDDRAKYYLDFPKIIIGALGRIKNPANVSILVGMLGSYAHKLDDALSESIKNIGTPQALFCLHLYTDQIDRALEFEGRKDYLKDIFKSARINNFNVKIIDNALRLAVQMKDPSLLPVLERLMRSPHISSDKLTAAIDAILDETPLNDQLMTGIIEENPPLSLFVKVVKKYPHIRLDARLNSFLNRINKEIKDHPNFNLETQFFNSVDDYLNSLGSLEAESMYREYSRIRSLAEIVHLNLQLCLDSLTNIKVGLSEIEPIKDNLPLNNPLTKIIRMLGEPQSIVDGYQDVTKLVIGNKKLHQLINIILYLVEERQDRSPQEISNVLGILNIRLQSGELAAWDERDWDKFEEDIKGYYANGFKTITSQFFDYYRKNKNNSKELAYLKDDIAAALPVEMAWGGFNGFSNRFKKKYKLTTEDELALLGKFLPIKDQTAKFYRPNYLDVQKALERKEDYSGEIDSTFRTLYEFSDSQSAHTTYEKGSLEKDKFIERLKLILTPDKINPVNMSEGTLMSHFLGLLVKRAGLDPKIFSECSDDLTLQRVFLSRWHQLLIDTLRDLKSGCLDDIQSSFHSASKSEREEWLGNFVKVKFIPLKAKKGLSPTQELIDAIKNHNNEELQNSIYKQLFFQVTADDLDPKSLRKWFAERKIKICKELEKETSFSAEEIGRRIEGAFEGAVEEIKNTKVKSDEARRNELFMPSIERMADRKVNELIKELDQILSGFSQIESKTTETYYVGLFDDLLHLVEFMMTGVCTYYDRSRQVREGPHFSVLAAKNKGGRIFGMSQVQILKTPIEGIHNPSSEKGFRVLALTGINLFEGALPMERQKAFMSLIECAYQLGKKANVTPVIVEEKGIRSNDNTRGGVNSMIDNLLARGILRRVKLSEKVILSKGSHPYSYDSVLTIQIPPAMQFLKESSKERALHYEKEAERLAEKHTTLIDGFIELIHNGELSEGNKKKLIPAIETTLAGFPRPLVERIKQDKSEKDFTVRVEIDLSLESSKIIKSDKSHLLILGKDVLYAEGKIETLTLSEKLSELLAAIVSDDYQDIKQAQATNENAFFKLELLKSLINYRNYLPSAYKSKMRYDWTPPNYWEEKTQQEKQRLITEFQTDLDRFTKGMSGLLQWNIFLSVMEDVDPRFLVSYYLHMLQKQSALKSEKNISELIKDLSELDVSKQVSLAQIRNVMKQFYFTDEKVFLRLGEKVEEKDKFSNFDETVALKQLKTTLVLTKSQNEFYSSLKQLMKTLLPLDEAALEAESRRWVLEDNLFEQSPREEVIQESIKELLIRSIGEEALFAVLQQLRAERGFKDIPLIRIGLPPADLPKGDNADKYGSMRYMHDEQEGQFKLEWSSEKDDQSEAPPADRDWVKKLFRTNPSDEQAGGVILRLENYFLQKSYFNGKLGKSKTFYRLVRAPLLTEGSWHDFVPTAVGFALSSWGWGLAPSLVGMLVLRVFISGIFIFLHYRDNKSPPAMIIPAVISLVNAAVSAYLFTHFHFSPIHLITIYAANAGFHSLVNTAVLLINSMNHSRSNGISGPPIKISERKQKLQTEPARIARTPSPQNTTVEPNLTATMSNNDFTSDIYDPRHPTPLTWTVTPYEDPLRKLVAESIGKATSTAGIMDRIMNFSSDDIRGIFDKRENPNALKSFLSSKRIGLRRGDESKVCRLIQNNLRDALDYAHPNFSIELWFIFELAPQYKQFFYQLGTLTGQDLLTFLDTKIKPLNPNFGLKSPLIPHQLINPNDLLEFNDQIRRQILIPQGLFVQPSLNGKGLSVGKIVRACRIRTVNDRIIDFYLLQTVGAGGVWDVMFKEAGGAGGFGAGVTHEDFIVYPIERTDIIKKDIPNFKIHLASIQKSQEQGLEISFIEKPLNFIDYVIAHLLGGDAPERGLDKIRAADLLEETSHADVYDFVENLVGRKINRYDASDAMFLVEKILKPSDSFSSSQPSYIRLFLESAQNDLRQNPQSIWMAARAVMEVEAKLNALCHSENTSPAFVFSEFLWGMEPAPSPQNEPPEYSMARILLREIMGRELGFSPDNPHDWLEQMSRSAQNLSQFNDELVRAAKKAYASEFLSAEERAQLIRTKISGTPTAMAPWGSAPFPVGMTSSWHGTFTRAVNGFANTWDTLCYHLFLHIKPVRWLTSSFILWLRDGDLDEFRFLILGSKGRRWVPVYAEALQDHIRQNLFNVDPHLERYEFRQNIMLTRLNLSQVTDLEAFLIFTATRSEFSLISVMALQKYLANVSREIDKRVIETLDQRLQRPDQFLKDFKNPDSTENQSESLYVPPSRQGSSHLLELIAQKSFEWRIRLLISLSNDRDSYFQNKNRHTKVERTYPFIKWEHSFLTSELDAIFDQLDQRFQTGETGSSADYVGGIKFKPTLETAARWSFLENIKFSGPIFIFNLVPWLILKYGTNTPVLVSQLPFATYIVTLVFVLISAAVYGDAHHNLYRWVKGKSGQWSLQAEPTKSRLYRRLIFPSMGIFFNIGFLWINPNPILAMLLSLVLHWFWNIGPSRWFGWPLGLTDSRLSQKIKAITDEELNRTFTESWMNFYRQTEDRGLLESALEKTVRETDLDLKLDSLKFHEKTGHPKGDLSEAFTLTVLEKMAKMGMDNEIGHKLLTGLSLALGKIMTNKKLFAGSQHALIRETNVEGNKEVIVIFLKSTDAGKANDEARGQINSFQQDGPRKANTQFLFVTEDGAVQEKVNQLSVSFPHHVYVSLRKPETTLGELCEQARETLGSDLKKSEFRLLIPRGLKFPVNFLEGFSFYHLYKIITDAINPFLVEVEHIGDLEQTFQSQA